MTSRTVLNNARKHEKAIRKGIAEGLNFEHIASDIGASKSSVMKWCAVLNIPPPARQIDYRVDPVQIQHIINQRNNGLTLQAIGDSVGLTRERVRQVLVKYSPDKVIVTQRAIEKTCSVCGKKFYGKGQTCSTRCGGVFRWSGRWTRNKALQIIECRKRKMTWEQVADVVDPGCHVLAFRAALQREKEKLFSTEEWNTISGHVKKPETQDSLYRRLMKWLKGYEMF